MLLGHGIPSIMRSLYLLLLVAPLAVHAVPLLNAEQSVHNSTTVDVTSGRKNCHSISPLSSNLWYFSVVHDITRLTSLVVQVSSKLQQQPCLLPKQSLCMQRNPATATTT